MVGQDGGFRSRAGERQVRRGLECSRGRSDGNSGDEVLGGLGVNERGRGLVIHVSRGGGRPV